MPTRDGVIVAILAALLLFVAVNLQAGWVYAVDALLLGLLLAGAISARVSVRGLAVERTIPAQVIEGEDVQVTLTCRTARWPMLFVELTDAVAGLEPSQMFITLLRPGAPLRLCRRTKATRRGVYAGGHVTIRSTGASGLFAASRRLEVPGTITILPQYWPLRHFPLPGFGRYVTASAPRVTRSGLEFHGVRDFRDGDSLRHVHWRSTARRGTLVVREYEDAAQGGVTLLLDARAHVHSGDGPRSSFEDLVRAAASVAHFVTHTGRAARIVTSQGNALVNVAAGWEGLWESLARVTLDGRMAPADLCVAAALPALTPVVVFTPDPQSVLPLAGRGMPVTAVLLDRASYADEGTGRRDADTAVLEALGVPVCILERGKEIAACLETWG